ncbi:MAG TPA: hypothetical protein VHL53_21565 [Acidimicrobiia bacterium]|nr:hypothetical protein [Acidimicrobiia bacterium]
MADGLNDGLTPPEFRALHAFVKYSLIVLMLAMIAEGSFFAPYIIVRFGLNRLYGG